MANIWTRARVQAFAHQVAVDRLDKAITEIKTREMRVAVVGIALLVVGYTFGFFPPPDTVPAAQESAYKTGFTIASNALLFLSTLTGIFGLYLTVTSERDQLITTQSRHKTMLRMFMNISGKTRCTAADIYDEGFYKFYISHLNELIASLQTAGENPTNEDYQEAHTRHQNLLKSPHSDIVDSFAPEPLLADADEKPA